jgi:hypothetical protein
MAPGDLDQFSVAVGRFESSIETLTDGFRDFCDKLTTVMATVHSHSERLDKIEPRIDMLHQHHTGRSAIWGFLKAIPYVTIGGLIPPAAAYVPWKSLLGPLLH